MYMTLEGNFLQYDKTIKILGFYHSEEICWMIRDKEKSDKTMWKFYPTMKKIHVMLSILSDETETFGLYFVFG